MTHSFICYKAYSPSKEVLFSGELLQIECQNPLGCSRKTSAIPYCWQHMRTNLCLNIKESNIPKSGKGLFAYCPFLRDKGVPVFKKYDMICDYIGEPISSEELEKRYRYSVGKKQYDPTGPYVLEDCETGWIYDGALLRGAGAIANDARGSGKRPNASLVSSDIKKGDKFPGLMATRNIYHDEEILVSYGREYWNNLKYISHKTIRSKK